MTSKADQEHIDFLRESWQIERQIADIKQAHIVKLEGLLRRAQKFVVRSQEDLGERADLLMDMRSILG